MNTSILSTSIQSFIETKKDTFNDDTQLKSLYTGELYLDEIIDDVTIVVKYRPDEYPDWTEWFTFTICASVSQCKPPNSKRFNCKMWKTKKSTYASRILLTTPDEVENKLTGGYLKDGYQFQFRFEIIGHCRIQKWMPQATLVDDRSEGEEPDPNPDCVEFSSCNLDWFGYSSYGMKIEYSGTYTIPNGASSGTVTGLNLGFTPTKIFPSVVVPDTNSEVLTVNGTSNLSADGFDFILSGATDGPCYVLNFILKL